MGRMLTLKKQAEFKRVYGRGKKTSNRHMTVYAAPNKCEQYRYGFSINKKVGNAVVRNRLRRRLKEALRAFDLCAPVVSDARKWHDVVIVARPTLAERSYAELRGDLSRLLERIHIL